jgi:AP-3 complex subunit beta
MVRQSGPSNKFNPVRLAELLQSKYNEDLLEAIKMIFLSYLFNRDISVYLSRIISFVPRDDGELKRLCYILLTEVAHT